LSAKTVSIGIGYFSWLCTSLIDFTFVLVTIFSTQFLQLVC
jgi:hypothetical protein